ncbi:hypothetical protein [Sporomusa acidovorans]|uniref:Flagellar motor switch protein FliG n=1 Tax=Sporomusa acidovorans (strain ATCC 49682 / DSM 3132 / Mol) TaxID=1123286 RepID=A0ABZ3J2W3_SPOA4|nr:hypothetical protein [Sporomusa acidovorans]OZC20037.1 flagellar motor switch protein G [Sporomusa acidovorans DSM 3132]SDD46885.1 FliG N-terminal domain-containing protein [Sporomusa acidovorans]
MSPIKKVAIFLVMIGKLRAQGIIMLMDNDEIRVVVAEIRKLKEISHEIQNSIWTEFKELGYEDQMKSSEILTIIRFLFDGRKISETGRY